MDPITLRVLERFIRGAKALQPGMIVRYVGAQSPKLAGLEGEVVEVEGGYATVNWKYRGVADEKYAFHELKPIRAYSRRFQASRT